MSVLGKGMPAVRLISLRSSIAPAIISSVLKTYGKKHLQILKNSATSEGPDYKLCIGDGS